MDDGTPPVVSRFAGDPWSFMVLSRKEATRYAAAEPHVVISMTSPRCDGFAELPDAPLRRAALRLAFDDFDYAARQFTDEELTEGGAPPVFFSREHALRIRDFVSEHKEHVPLILCHCEAGASRSPAVAAALSRWLSGSDDIADAISHWVGVERMGLDEGVIVWNRLVHDVLTAVLTGADQPGG